MDEKNTKTYQSKQPEKSEISNRSKALTSLQIIEEEYGKDSPEYQYFRDTPKAFSTLPTNIRKDILTYEIGATLNAATNHKSLKSEKPQIDSLRTQHLEKVMGYINKYYCPDFSKLQDILLNPHDFLVVLRFSDYEVVVPFHPSSEGIILDDLARRGLLKKRISTGEEKLKEDMDRESYMDGNLVVVYKTVQKGVENAILPALALWGTASTAQGIASAGRAVGDTDTGRKGIDLAKVAGSKIATASRKIDAIFYKGLDGKLMSVDVSTLGQLDIVRGEVPTNLLSLLSEKGIIMDPISGKFSPIASLTMRDVVMNFEYMRAPKGISEKDWSKFQTDIRDMEGEYRSIVKSGKTTSSIVALQGFLKSSFAKRSYAFMKGIKGGFMHAVFWPVFFKKYHANMQDKGARDASLAEAGLFMAGAKLGAKIPAPLMARPVMGLIAGGLAVMAGEHFAENFDLDRKYWIENPDREDTGYKESTAQDGNSKFGNILSGGPIYRLLDKLGGDFAVTPKGGIDLKLGYNVPKIINGQVALVRETVKDTFLPRIAFLETSVSFQTNPREYMGAAMGRDVALWNKRVYEYSAWLSREVDNLQNEYKKGEGIFRSENIMKVEIDPDSDFYKRFILSRRIDIRDKSQMGVRSMMAIEQDGKSSSGYNLIEVELYDEIEMKKKYLFNTRVMQMMGADGAETLKKIWTAPQGIKNAYSMRSIANRTTEWLDYREEPRIQNTRMLVMNMTDQLKIDANYIRMETLDLRTRELALQQRLVNFADQFESKKKAYILDLFRRIRAKDNIIKPNNIPVPNDSMIMKGNGNGLVLHVGMGKGDIIPGRGNARSDMKFIPYQEYVWWKELLESNEKYIPKENGESIDALDGLENKNLDKALSGGAIDLGKLMSAMEFKSSDVFYQLLKDMVDFKRQEEFVSNIQKYGTGQKWYGLEIFDNLYDIPSVTHNKPNGMLKAIKDNPFRF